MPIEKEGSSIVGTRDKDAKRNADIDTLKQRFSQMKQPSQPVASQQPSRAPAAPFPQQQQASQPVQQPSQPVAQQHPQQPPQQYPQQPPSQPAPQPAQPQDPSAAPQQHVPPQQPASAPAPSRARSPLEALQNAPQQPTNPVNFVEVEGPQGAVVQQETVTPGQALPAQEGEPAEEQNTVEESLEELKEEYDDAKLNSIIIEQVKELIEIDTNLNNKIEDVRVDLKKEIEDRKRMEKTIDEHYKELKELEKSIDKFIALYELVTNQFNPFVKQDDPETRQKMQGLMQQVHQHAPAASSYAASPHHSAQAQPKQQAVAHPDLHFVTRTGARIKDLQGLIQFLDGMNEEEFSHHVTPEKNDFAAWLHHALKAESLAAAAGSMKTKQELLALLKQAQERSGATQSPSIP